MQTLREIAGWVFGGVLEALGETAGEILGFVIVGLLMLAGTLLIYFLLKKLSGRKTTFKEDVVEAVLLRHTKGRGSLIFAHVLRYRLPVSGCLGSGHAVDDPAAGIALFTTALVYFRIHR